MLEKAINDFIFKHNLNPDFYGDLKRLFDIDDKEKQVRYIFTKDEYGEMAEKWYKDQWQLRRVYDGDAGIDLPVMLSREEQKVGYKTVWAGEREMLHTGIIVEFPVGYWGRIIHRSSTEKKHRLRVVEGVIDDYRGEVLVQVHNPNTSNVEIHHGDRLGQLIVAKTCSFKVLRADELRPSARGANGFGSSGK